MSRLLIPTINVRDDIDVLSASGCSLHLANGREVLDMFVDNGVVSLGYNHPAVVDTIREMLDGNTPLHSPNLYYNRWRDRSAEFMTKASGMERVFYCNSGTESVEMAMKIARKYLADDRRHIYAAWSGFHGRTYGSMSVEGVNSDHYHMSGFGPLLDCVSFFDDGANHYGDPPRSGPLPDIESLPWASGQVGAILMSTVNGNNDVRTYSGAFWGRLRELCDEHDALLILDEVQCGWGRFGHMMAYHAYKFFPDIVCFGKGVAGGMPMGATLVNDKLKDVITPGSHWSTFGGSPLTTAVQYAVGKAIQKRLPEVRRIGATTMELLGHRDWVTAIRGGGYMMAIDVPFDAFEFARRVFDKHQIFIGAFRPTHFRLTPPLIAGADEFSRTMDAMDQIAATMERRSGE